jgi:hypothetical protein
MNKKLIAASALCTVAVLAGCTKKTASTIQDVDQSEARRTPIASVSATPKATNDANELGMMNSGYKFKLAAVKSSGREGTAYLSEEGGKVKVTIEMLDNNSATAAAMPAHIHLGSCPAPEAAPKYPLTNVVNGKSETVLPAGVTIASLKALGKTAINVHKSAADLKTYVSCGDLDWKNVPGENAMDKEGTGSAKASKSPKASTTAKPSKTPAASVSASPRATQ